MTIRDGFGQTETVITSYSIHYTKVYDDDPGRFRADGDRNNFV
ncbi:acyl--CoA ligase [Streptomyces cyaneogriseus]|nr:acyl--CoA ligase [Streptomyces cyaneogriseus]